MACIKKNQDLVKNFENDLMRNAVDSQKQLEDGKKGSLNLSEFCGV